MNLLNELISAVGSGGLGSLFDSDGDGSVVDDLLGMARKFIR